MCKGLNLAVATTAATATATATATSTATAAASAIATATATAAASATPTATPTTIRTTTTTTTRHRLAIHIDRQVKEGVRGQPCQKSVEGDIAKTKHVSQEHPQNTPAGRRILGTIFLATD